MTAAAGDVAELTGDDGGDVDRLVVSVELAHARRLARAGHYTEADDVLSRAKDTPAGLDLRARIAAQQGRYDKAVALWSDAATRRGDPDAYAAELAAVDRLRNRRHGAAPFVAAGVILGGALAAGGGWVAAQRWSATDDDRTAVVAASGAADSDAAPEQPADEDAATTTTTTTAEAVAPIEPAQSGPVSASTSASASELLERRLRGVAGIQVVAGEDGALAVTFTAAAFSEGVTLTPAAEAALGEVATVLASAERDGDRVIVVVTGRTDGLAVLPGSRYADNDELAVARARAGVAQLVLGGLPTERTTVDVAHTAPGDRTLGLTIYPQVQPG